MSQIENILQKINSDYDKIKEQLAKEFEHKKNELKNSFNQKLLKQKSFLDEKYLQQFELEKKRIFTEEFIKFNKTIEAKKQELLKKIFSLATKKIFEISKTEYRDFIKNLIIKNLFLDKRNDILFDETNNLSEQEKNVLIEEIANQIKKLHKNTELKISNNKGQKISFGIIIFSGKQSKDLSLESLLNMLKLELEIEAAKNLFG